MILFIRNIPANSHPSELQHYVASAVKRNFFFRSGRILKCDVLVLMDKRTKAFEFHGMVHVDSDKAGERAIQQLKGKRFKNKLVMVREFKFRSWHNDRRLRQGGGKDNLLENRRNDRRRGDGIEVVKDIAALFSSSEVFLRKY